MNFSRFSALAALPSKIRLWLSGHSPASKGGLNALNEGKASILVKSLTVPKPQFLTTP